MSAGLAQQTVHPVLIARFDILSDPLTCWTGPGVFAPSSTGDTAMDGQIFAGLPPLMGIGDIVEDFGPGGPTTITIAGHQLDQVLLKQVVRDRREWRGRKAWMWMGLLDSDNKTVLTNPVRIKTGIMASMTTIRNSDTYEVQVTIDRDLGRAQGSVFRLMDHIRFYPSDKFSTWLPLMANQSENFAIKSIYKGTGSYLRRPEWDGAIDGQTPEF
jgi:hypothetical protein